jgi:hypothetical protein
VRAHLVLASCLVACFAAAPPARAADSLDACKLIRPGEASRVMGKTVRIRRGESLQSCNLRYRGANIILTAYRMTRRTFKLVRSNERRGAGGDDPCVEGVFRNVREFGVPAFETDYREVAGEECPTPSGEVNRSLVLYRHRRQLFLATGTTHERYAATLRQLRALARIANRRY